MTCVLCHIDLVSITCNQIRVSYQCQCDKPEVAGPRRKEVHLNLAFRGPL